MRSTIALLLVAATAIGGCDRQSEAQRQGNDATAANVQAPAPAGSLDRSHKGEAAPDFPFLDPAGKRVTLASYRGKPVLLNLWATWCAPCVKEMPTLDVLAGRLGDAVQVIPLSQDSQEGSEAKVVAFLDPKRFPHLRAWRDPDMGFSMNMGVNLPATILYDSAGKEVWRMTGDMDWAGEAAAKLVAEGR